MSLSMVEYRENHEVNPITTNLAAASAIPTVVRSLPAAAPMSLNINTLECECESVITKASGPCCGEAYYHANKEMPTPMVTGVVSGALSGGPSVESPMHTS